jgi:hypothetical protein
MSKQQKVNQLIIESLTRLNRPATFSDIVDDLKSNGFEFTRRLCINDIYVFGRRCRDISKLGPVLYQLNLEVA